MKYILILFCLITKICGAQNTNAVNEKIRDILSGPDLNLNDVIDTVGLYTFTIKLEVFSGVSKTYVGKISTNNILVSKFYKNLDTLKTLDFTPFFKGKETRATIVIPVAIILAYPKIKVQKPTLDAEKLIEKLYNLFDLTYPVPNEDISLYKFAQPVILTCGVKVYN